MVEEELQAAERRLPAPSGKSDEVGRAQESVAVDGAEEFAIARREDHAAHRGALEARATSLDLGHVKSAYRPAHAPQRRRYQPPNQRAIFASTSSLGRPYRSREWRTTASRRPFAVPRIGGRVRPRKGAIARP